jgi:uncharacterized protein YPO0396
MMKLEAVRLIHWYHFQHELLPLGGSCLLLGDNGSGKSTVLDAIQLALVADLKELRFNKAANENSRRSLHGYVRHKLGSEDETRPGQVRFGRGACTGYVMLRFVDERGARPPFVCGMVLEATEEDTSVDKWGFVVPSAALEDIPALAEGEVVRGSREFRPQLKALPGAQAFPDVATYRAEVRHRLGALPESFHRLLVKALDFKPIGQVRDFVFHYLLDERPVDTASLQANIEHYKRLEAEAQQAERRIVQLDALCEKGEQIVQRRRVVEAHEYLVLRARKEQAEERLQAIEERLEQIASERKRLSSQIGQLGEQLTFFDREKDRLIALLQNHPTYNQVQQLQSELERARQELEHAEQSEAEARRLLAGQTGTLELLLSGEARDLRRKHPELFTDELVGVVEEPPLVQRLRQALARQGSLAGRDLSAWRRRLESAADMLYRACMRLEDQLRQAREEGEALQAERAELERGQQRYEPGVEALLYLLRSRLKGQRKPMPLCELIEVPNERWRNAVEGYLNTRRFDVLVDPEDFPRALTLYEKHKRGYSLPGRGEIFISGVGLVNLARLQERKPMARPRSLAEQVKTDDPLARLYCDFSLGEVICCESEQELWRHARAITDSVMVYQNYTARQVHPGVYKRHFIGQAARLRRMDAIDARLGELHDLLVSLAADVTWLEEARKKCSQAKDEVLKLEPRLQEAEALPTLRLRVPQLERRLELMDRRELEKLELERTRVDQERARLSQEQKQAIGAEGELKGEARTKEEERDKARNELEQARQQMESSTAAREPERRAEHEDRYRRERSTQPPARVIEVYEHQRRIAAGTVENLVRELISMKANFAKDYGFAADPTGEGYAEHALERERWTDSKLPESRSRLEEAKRRATEQLAEDIIFRLRENLLHVQRQLDDLNRALKDVPFNGDRYQFTREVEPTHKLFYDLIMMAGQFERESLFGSQALADGEARHTLQGLVDRLLEAEARQVKTELEARADYREYFNYDLRIHHADGTSSSYNRVAGDKSGGETQTPYYIAILASMYRLYRTTSADGKAACGLVLLDEAFSKMDEPRIVAMLRFARELGLQLVMATPKERSELVAPGVERCLLIHKDLQTGEPSVLDFTRELTRREPAGT